MSSIPMPTKTDAATRVVALDSQYPAGLLGIPSGVVRLTWRIASDDPSARQIAYQLASARGCRSAH